MHASSSYNCLSHTHKHQISLCTCVTCMSALQPVTANCQKGQEMCRIVITQDSLCFLFHIQVCLSVVVHIHVNVNRFVLFL